MNTISHLTHSRILTINPTPIHHTIHEGTRKLSIEDTFVLARVRDLSTTIQFFCRNHKIANQGTFIGIHSAIVDATSLMTQYGLTPQSDGELRVYLTIREHTVALLRPDQHVFRSIPYDDRHDTHRLIQQLPTHGVHEQEQLIWSSHWTPDTRSQAVKSACEAFESHGRFPGTCIDDIREIFRTLPI